MSNRLSVLMIVYNEADFVEYAIKACLPYVDDLVIVEGAFQESIACGAEPRSTDGTIEIIEKIRSELDPDPFYENQGKVTYADSKVAFLQVNEQTDKDQRNVGLEKIKELNPEGWLLIIDGDEVYTKENFVMVRNFMRTMEMQNKYAAYFKSLTFVNDFNHFTEQEFPRLFRITPKCEFVNDNFMVWTDKQLTWAQPHVIKLPYLRYHHYAFCKKDQKRFQLKKDWWETRFGNNYNGTGKPFEYDWYINEDGKIYSPNHTLILYTGKHPTIMETHPLWVKSYREKKLPKE